MTERTVTDSFVVRIYRIDTADRRKITGQAESMDGSGERTPFTNIDELTAILNRAAQGAASDE